MVIFNDNNPIILNNFLLFLLDVKNFSKTTVSEYRIDLLVFFRFIKKYYDLDLKLKDFDVFTLANIKESDILAFLVYLNINRNCTVCTRKRKICSIRSFYKWLFGFYGIPNSKNPTNNLPAIQKIERIPKYLNLEQSKRLINIFNCRNSRFHIRNNTIIALFLNSGMRISELVKINLNDIDFNDGSIKIIQKGNKERICLLNSNTKKKLIEYLRYRNKNEKNVCSSSPLFISKNNKRISIRTVQNIVKKAYELAGLSENGYTTHTLRHTFATLMYQYGNVDILLLKEFLGHTTIKSTEIYTHVHNDILKNAVNSNPLNDYYLE